MHTDEYLWLSCTGCGFENLPTFGTWGSLRRRIRLRRRRQWFTKTTAGILQGVGYQLLFANLSECLLRFIREEDIVTISETCRELAVTKYNFVVVKPRRIPRRILTTVTTNQQS
jgi:hypothetical protein